MSRNLWQTLTLRKTSVQGSSWQRGEEWGWPINDDVPFAMATDLNQREPSPPPHPPPTPDTAHGGARPLSQSSDNQACGGTS